MQFNKLSLFIFLWAIAPLCGYISARYTQFPNQEYVIYGIVLSLFSVFLFRDIVNIIFVQLKWLVWPIGYAFAFITVSYLGVDFEESIKYQVQYLPLITIDFFVAFIIGYKFHEVTIFKYILIASGFSVFILLVDAFLFPSSRMGTLDLNIAMLVPLAILSGTTAMALAALFVLLASTKKTITVIVLLSFAAALWVKVLNSRKHTRTVAAESRSAVVTWFWRIAGVIAIVVVAGYLAGNIQTTYERLTEELDGDPMRSAISALSFELLEEKFPEGIGLGGFSSVSQGTINYQSYDARGEIVTGANLHSSYMTWALEGGLPIVLIMMSLLIFTLRAIRYFLKNIKSRMLGWVILIWLFQGMLFGMFHQWHNTAPFWTLFGLLFGCYERYKRVK